MPNKFFYLFCFFLISNCSMPHTTFLGPIYTGVKSGSVYQTSLSYTSSKILKDIREEDTSSISSDYPVSTSDPVILLAYKVDFVEFSDVIEPEPLP